MKTSLLPFLPCAVLAAGTLASLSDVGIQSRAVDDSVDDLDEWLTSTKRVSPEALRPCPVSCSATGNSSSTDGWFLFPDPTKLALCNETMILNMVVQTESGDNKASQPVVRACTADYESRVKLAFVPDDEKASLCTTANRVLEEASVYMHHPQVGDDDGFSVSHAVTAGRQMVNRLAQQEPSCTRNAMEFGYFQSSAIGVFAGAEVHQHGVSSVVLRKLLEYAQEKGVSKTTVVQLCGADERGADYSIGVVATSAKNLRFVHKAVKAWANGGCVSQADAGEDWIKVTLRVPAPVDTITPSSSSPTTNTNGTHGSSNFTTGARSRLAIRADCTTTTVQSGDGCWAVANRCGITQANLEKYNRANLCTTLVKDEKVCCSSGTLPSTLPAGNSDGTCKTRSVISGDDCGSLASKCGISPADFMKVNTKTNLCATLAVGQQVCCTNGKMPDLKPKPDANGNCATYTTQKDDSCSVIAAARDLNVTDLETFNKNTWGWNGCKLLFPDFKMCVSTGSPPMPAPVANAVCGPTVPGTAQPSAGTNLTTLNPCPLNVCCNIWGQCGMTDDFCVVSKSETGAPGTSAPGKNGCISNCGRDIIKGSAPASKIKVAYYESWNFGRECLNMMVDQIDTSAYTHIHFAFATITSDFKVDIGDDKAKEQFEIFKKMSGIKKIISFGGWDFSALPGTFSILRNAVLPANRETFKNNIVAFVQEHGLDGVDLDWEYPGAPDIPDIPSDDPQNGLNYYRLLSSLKSTLGSSKTVSFAAPASFWYLKAFPIKNMVKDLDYIIYMTYDLHGQWDYGNKWTSPGCETGNCLRSHVNETETKDALSMITKAGAPSNKVVVGVASYGRSFKMAQAGCDSESCLFTGSPRDSNAAKGRCTATGGYISNAEINEIIATGNVNRQWKKEGSNMMVYNDTEWVAWMDDDTKAARAAFYDSYNFAGITDWAVDLQEFVDDSSIVDDVQEAYIDPNYWSRCTGTYTTLDQLESHKDSIPHHCMDKYIVDVQVAVMEGALNKYKDLIDKGYDKKFSIYENYVKAQIPDQINNFMASEKVDKYFKCKEYKYVTCCGSCRYACVCENGCTKSGYQLRDMDKCPKFETTVVGFGGTEIPNATFTLTDSKGFYEDISKTWGIEESWITFDRRHMRTNNGCQYAGEKVLECIDKNDDCVTIQSYWWYNYPQPSDKVEIYNPKNVVGDSYPKAQDMLNRFKVVKEFSYYDELFQVSDVVDATSLPAFTTAEGVENMGKIVEKADEIKKKERESFILDFLMGLLFWIPVVGELVGPELAAIGNVLRLIGAVGDAAMTIYDVVQNPKNAFGAIFGLLAGAGVGRKGFKDAAGKRRDLTGTKEFNALGNVKTQLDRIEVIRSVCRR